MGKIQARRKRVPAPLRDRNAPSGLWRPSRRLRQNQAIYGQWGGNSATAYTPAAASRQHPDAHRRASRLRSVYVGERWHKHDGGIVV